MVLFSLNISAFDGLVDSVKEMGWKLNILSPINAGAFAMLLSIAIVPIVSSFTKAPDQKVVDNAFSCLKKAEPKPAK